MKKKKKYNKHKEQPKMKVIDWITVIIVILFLIILLFFGVPPKNYYPGKPPWIR